MTSGVNILNGLPAGLRSELLSAYEDISRNYAERKWTSAELDSGKFCEVVYSILRGLLIGPMPAKATKPTNMLMACLELERNAQKNSARIGDHSLRILIPRMIPAMYDIRNNRNVGHVGGDVDPSFMDATAVYSMVSWMLAELIRIFHGVGTQEAQETVDSLVERKHPLIWETGSVRRVLDPAMRPKDQTLLLLHSKAGWVLAKDLWRWIEYSTVGNFRAQILKVLHDARLIEFDRDGDKARLSPLGAKEVEDRILQQKRANP